MSEQATTIRTPMLTQYQTIKQQVSDCFVFFRLGDFYELFYEDAVIASKLLDLVLTGRGQNELRAPMCGVPYHSATSYIQKLVDLGHRVAIVEQMEDPALTKGLVKREVVRIVTPGTTLDTQQDETRSVRIAAVTRFANSLNVVMCELISGDVWAMHERYDESLVASELLKHHVREVIVAPATQASWVKELKAQGVLINEVETDALTEDYAKYFEALQEPALRQSAGRLIHYLVHTQKRPLTHLKPLRLLQAETFMGIDYQTSVNLELVEALHQDHKEASLFGFLNACETAMGARRLKQWILRPLVDRDDILKRQAIITALLGDFKRFDHIQAALGQCYDLERIIGRLALGSANPQDFLRLRQTLNQVDPIQSALSEAVFEELVKFDPLIELKDQLNRALNDQQPATIKDGNVFKTGYHPTLDEHRAIQTQGKTWLLDFEQKERQRTGIKNLKVGYNRVFGYYLEVSKGQLDQVLPEYGYVRKQTLSNQERFITDELKQMEDQILHAAERSLRLEEELFQELIETSLGHRQALQIMADQLSIIDVLMSLTHKAKQHHWVRPDIHTGLSCHIVEGRHPILDAQGRYVSNTTHFDESHTVQLLTGPNMGGKSTYMRQVALLFILAQMGSYIPAKQATMPIVDALYTRMGASDDIIAGQSTFMVEMNQANLALQKATQRSLILFDEIGRGTSTYDGMAIALAMVEFISTQIKSKCIFSTHYHELTQLEQSLPSVQNIHVDVVEHEHQLEFLYRVKPGKADRSYGINVAKLANIPHAVLKRAEAALKELESAKRTVQQSLEIVELVHIPKTLERIQNELKAIDLNQTTPLEALKYLDAWKKDLD